MKKSRLVMAITILVLVTTLFTLASACTTQPPAQQTIKLGFSIPLTGPAAEKGAPIGQGSSMP